MCICKRTVKYAVITVEANIKIYYNICPRDAHIQSFEAICTIFSTRFWFEPHIDNTLYISIFVQRTFCINVDMYTVDLSLCRTDAKIDKNLYASNTDKFRFATSQNA